MKIFPRELFVPSPDKGESNCPFCNLDTDNIIWKGEYFYIQHNKYPYMGLRNHLMAIPFRHIRETSDLTKEELGGLLEVENFMKEFFSGEKYFTFIRHSGLSKTINHIHYHYLPGELNPEDIEIALIKKGYEPNTNFD